MTQTLSGLGGIGAPNTVGNQTPEWEFPLGIDRVSQQVREAFLRTDAGPSGINAATPPSAAATDEFRRLINAGIIKPKNEAATNISRSQGGMRAGDQSLLGAFINGMPEGLTPEYWGVVIQKAQQAANEQIAIMDKTGYFDGKSTMDRQRMEADIANNIANTEIQRRLSDNTIRQTDMDDAYKRDAMAQDMRQNIIAQFGYDPGPQGAAGLVSGNKSAAVAGADGVQPLPGSQGTPDPNAPPELHAAAQQQAQQTQAQQASASGGAPGVAGQTPPPGMPGGPPVTPGAGQYGQVGAGGTRPNMTTQVGQDVGWQWVDGQGWQQTLGGRQQDLAQQQQAFTQQQAQAALASNPRNYIEAQMLGSSRGGLGGMAPNNQVNPTTGMPMSQAPGMGGQQWPAQPGMPGQLPGGMPFQGLVRQDGQPIDRDFVLNGGMSPQMGSGMQPGMQKPMPAMPVPDGMTGIEPWQMNQGGYDQRMAQFAQQGQVGSGPISMGPEQLAGQVTGIEPWQMNQGGMNRFQPPGMGGYGMAGLQRQPMAQPLQAGQPTMGMPGAMPQGMGQQPGQQNIAVGAFSNALNQNRLVPKSGGMGTNGSYQTMGQIAQNTDPNKWRAQDFMRGDFSQKQQALGTASAAGFSDEDTQSKLGKSLPTFKAPGAGAMV